MLELERNDTYLHYGCNSYVHYAQAVLRITVQEARSLYWVADQLRSLPILSRAAENGEIAWAALESVLRCATPDSEAYWLQMAQTRNLRRLERLVRVTLAQGRTAPENSPHTTRLILELDSDRVEIYENVSRHLRREAGRPLTKLETWDFMCAEILAGRPQQEHVEMPAPWVAVAAAESCCPGNAEVLVVQPAVPHWNERVRHTTPKQQAELLRRDGYR